MERDLEQKIIDSVVYAVIGNCILAGFWDQYKKWNEEKYGSNTRDNVARALPHSSLDSKKGQWEPQEAFPISTKSEMEILEREIHNRIKLALSCQTAPLLGNLPGAYQQTDVSDTDPVAYLGATNIIHFNRNGIREKRVEIGVFQYEDGEMINGFREVGCCIPDEDFVNDLASLSGRSREDITLSMSDLSASLKGRNTSGPIDDIDLSQQDYLETHCFPDQN